MVGGGGWVSSSSLRVRQQTFAKASPLVWRVRVAAIGTTVRRDDLFAGTRRWRTLERRFYDEEVRGGSNRGCENTVFYFTERFTVTGAGAATTRIISSFKYRARPRLTSPRRRLNKFKIPVAPLPADDRLDRERGRQGL